MAANWKGKGVSPDAFVGIRITSPSVRESLKHIQESIVKKNGKLEGAMVSLNTLHITLMVIKLEDNKERIEKYF